MESISTSCFFSSLCIKTFTISERHMREVLRTIKEVILFGSYAHGKPKEYSDIDLAVISDWFEGRPKIENMQYLSRIAATYNSLIEALPFTGKEYKNLDKRSFWPVSLKPVRSILDYLKNHNNRAR